MWVPLPHAMEGTHLGAPSAQSPLEQRLGAWTVRLSCCCDELTGSGSVSQEATAGQRHATRAAREPTCLWWVVEGRVRYRLPARSAYAVGSCTRAQVDALRDLKGDMWTVLLAAIPQIIPAGEACEGHDVLVELECCNGATKSLGCSGKKESA